MSELKPCPKPWCNGTGMLCDDAYNGNPYYVECDTCGMSTPNSWIKWEDAEAEWNTRPIEDAQRDLMLETARHLDRCAIALWDAFNGQHPDPGFLTNKAEEYKTCSFLATDLANRINRLERGE